MQDYFTFIFQEIEEENPDQQQSTRHMMFFFLMNWLHNKSKSINKSKLRIMPFICFFFHNQIHLFFQ